MLEVMGVYSSFHIAQLQVGLVDPIRLGQAKIVKVRKKILNSCKIHYCGKSAKELGGKTNTGAMCLIQVLFTLRVDPI